jgi:hypothetical protein
MDYIEVAGSIEEWVEMVRATNLETSVSEDRVAMQSTKNKEGMRSPDKGIPSSAGSKYLMIDNCCKVWTWLS